MTTGDIPLNGVFAQNHPLPLLLCALFTGVFAGAFLDIISVKDRLFGNNKIIGHFAEFFVVVMSYLLLFVSALNFNNGIIRWYHVACAVIGYRGYLRVLSRAVRGVVEAVYTAVEKVIVLVFRAILIPIRFFARIAVKLYRAAAKAARKRSKENAYKTQLAYTKKLASRGFDLGNFDDAKPKPERDRMRMNSRRQKSIAKEQKRKEKRKEWVKKRA